jgi:CBS domain-containing protein
VREWMTRQPVTAAPDTPAEDAARFMVAGAFHHLPITENQRPVGVLGLRLAIGALRPDWPGF